MVFGEKASEALWKELVVSSFDRVLERGVIADGDAEWLRDRISRVRSDML